MNTAPIIEAAPQAAPTLSKRWSDLSLDIERSIIYHARRRKFFYLIKILGDALAIATGSMTVYLTSWDSFGDGCMKLLGLCGIIIGIFDIVIGYAEMRLVYENLHAKFSELLRKINKSQPSEEKLVELTNSRLEIEETEPPVLRCLDADCHDQLAVRYGYPKELRSTITRTQRFFMHFFDYKPELLNRRDKL